MNYFLNLENGVLNVSTSRNVRAQATDLLDIQNALSNETNECLTASFTQDFDYDADLKVAQFSGICYNGDTGFEICVNQEAHNIESEEAGRGVWGLNEDLMPSI